MSMISKFRELFGFSKKSYEKSVKRTATNDYVYNPDKILDKVLDKVIAKLKKNREKLYKEDWMDDEYARISEEEWENISDTVRRQGIDSRHFSIFGMDIYVYEAPTRWNIVSKMGCSGTRVSWYDKSSVIHPVELVIRTYLDSLDFSHCYLT